MSTQPNVKDFFDPKTNTFSYVVSDPGTKQCAIIDSVLYIYNIISILIIV